MGVLLVSALGLGLSLRYSRRLLGLSEREVRAREPWWRGVGQVIAGAVSMAVGVAVLLVLTGALAEFIFLRVGDVLGLLLAAILPFAVQEFLHSSKELRQSVALLPACVGLGLSVSPFAFAEMITADWSFLSFLLLFALPLAGVWIGWLLLRGQKPLSWRRFAPPLLMLVVPLWILISKISSTRIDGFAPFDTMRSLHDILGWVALIASSRFLRRTIESAEGWSEIPADFKIEEPLLRKEES